MESSPNSGCILVIFGGTGDLTRRKLIPAIYNLFQGGTIPQPLLILSVSRQEKTGEAYNQEMFQSVQDFSRLKPDRQTWESINDRLFYLSFDFNDDHGYLSLDRLLKRLDQEYGIPGNRIFYLAVAPDYFKLIVTKLRQQGMADNHFSWQRLVIEKPFGRDLSSATALNQTITAVFSEKNIYRIDHYLGKEMLQNIMAIRFANPMFEAIWNSRFIDNVQITSAETVGVETRGDYYEKSGAIRDMVQNHMLQLLALIAMEPPVNLEAESIRDEKVKIFRSLKTMTTDQILENVIRGQYGTGMVNHKKVRSYRQEDRVDSLSNVETFVAFKTYIENFRWAGTPFYIRTGKRLPLKSTEIIIEFKPLPGILYFKEFDGLAPNLLVIKIQPLEGVFFQFNAKEPGAKNKIIPVQMNFCQNCSEESNSPEAYERLLADIIQGDSTLFTRWDEVDYSWKYVDPITKVWNENPPNFPNYPAGAWGPEAADRLLKADARQWRQI